jgi:hypothetical protein
MLEWLRGGNDRKLAATTYNGRESASSRAARKRRERHFRQAVTADRAGWRWADRQRERQDHGR